jgi:hypothetical protein
MEFLAWPAVVLILGLIALFMFKRNIAGRIDKIHKIDRIGMQIGSEQAQSLPEAKGSSFQELMDLASSPLLRERENNIRDALKARGISNEQESIKVLIRALASSQLTLQWEQIERGIFGSQVVILVEMNTKHAGLPVDVLRKVYDEMAKKYPSTYDGYTFDQYVGYLETNRLMTKGGDGYQVTLEGKEFMVWLVQSGRTYQRPN